MAKNLKGGREIKMNNTYWTNACNFTDPLVLCVWALMGVEVQQNRLSTPEFWAIHMC